MSIIATKKQPTPCRIGGALGFGLGRRVILAQRGCASVLFFKSTHRDRLLPGENPSELSSPSFASSPASRRPLSTKHLFWTIFLHLGAWRLASKDLGCGAGRAAFLYRHGPVLAGQCKSSARFVASGVFSDSNAGSSKLGGPVLGHFPVTAHSRP